MILELINLSAQIRMFVIFFVVFYLFWKVPDELWEEFVMRPDEFAERFIEDQPAERRQRRTRRQRTRRNRRNTRGSETGDWLHDDLDSDTDGIERLRQ
jgi:hypothetical protein